MWCGKINLLQAAENARLQLSMTIRNDITRHSSVCFPHKSATKHFFTSTTAVRETLSKKSQDIQVLLIRVLVPMLFCNIRLFFEAQEVCL